MKFLNNRQKITKINIANINKMNNIGDLNYQNMAFNNLYGNCAKMVAIKDKVWIK